MTAQQDNLKRNLLALKKSSFNIKFSLDGTDYNPIENIGSGAYGVVCSAVHKKTKKKVAIKKIPDIFDVTATAKRTYREIKILKHFKHDNIVAIREIIHPPEQVENFKDVYVVLDLMESDLHRIIYSHQELSEEHVRYFLYQILRGLKFIHSASVIHRDLKPSNLLVNENCDLKIGDFGMARGVSSNPEQHDYNLTQYVATRWYRAPEIMLGVLSYTTAVDMWSVGCIFAEMLRRKHLFPGRDLIDQLKLIIGTLGAPSREFIMQCQSPMLIDFIGALGQSKPVTLTKLCPKASQLALDLLSRLLVIDPLKRLTAEEALKHPYLAKYHDPDDEPVCVPVFNFDFEKEYLDSEALKKAIMVEITEYSNLKQVVPDAVVESIKTVKKDAPVLVTSGNEKPLASGLEAFLQKMKASQAQLNQRMQSNTNQTSNKIDTRLKTCDKPQKKDSPEKLDLKQQNLLNVTNNQSDVEMLSAKSQQTAAGAKVLPPGVGSEIETASDVPAATDTKAIIKAALMRKKQESGESGGKIRPVTAHQRMKEREEKRKEKMKRVMEKKKKKKKQDQEREASSLMLTSDDKSLLQRWTTMQQTTVPFVHPIRNLMDTHTNQLTTEASHLGQNSTTAHSILPSSSHASAQNVIPPSGQISQHPVLTSGAQMTTQAAVTSVGSSVAPVIVIDTNNITSNVHLQPSDYRPPYTQSTTLDTVSHLPPTFGLSCTADEQQSFVASLPASTQSSQQGAELDIVDLVTKQLSRHIGMENYFPPALAVTPKGTGEGYGVGMDLDALLNEALEDSKKGDSAKLDSAPLSASLLQDWLEVSGNVDLNDLEALQKELDMKSPMVFT